MANDNQQSETFTKIAETLNRISGSNITEPVSARFENYGDTCEYAVLETATFLAEKTELDSELQDAYDETDFDDNGTHFEDGQTFMKARGYVCSARGNTYNNENELSANYVWEVWQLEDEAKEDWVYADDSVFVVYLHGGGDPRSGLYSAPLFLRSTDYDYAAPMNLVAQFHVVEARERCELVREVALPLFAETETPSIEKRFIGWKELDRNETRSIDEKWQCGYSSLPFSQLESSVERWFMHTLSEDKSTVCVLLTSGHIAKVCVAYPY